MKISTKGRYGLKAIVDIAYSMQILNDKCVSVKSIAERQGISENYLEQIMAPLKKARIVHSIRGANGGYYLAKSPENLSAGEVLRILEGPIVPVDCVIDGTSVCGQVDCDLCVMRDSWHYITKQVNDVIDAITIAELAHTFDKLTKEKEKKGTLQ